jgi:hypothetical protein
MKAVLMHLNDEQIKQIEFLKEKADSKARTKVLAFCLEKTFNFYKDERPAV